MGKPREPKSIIRVPSKTVEIIYHTATNDIFVGGKIYGQMVDGTLSRYLHRKPLRRVDWLIPLITYFSPRVLAYTTTKQDRWYSIPIELAMANGYCCKFPSELLTIKTVLMVITNDKPNRNTKFPES